MHLIYLKDKRQIAIERLHNDYRKLRQNKKMVNPTPENDFLDNFANDQHQKMLREISNDDLTPKKRDTFVQEDVYEDDNLDYDIDSMQLTEY